MTDTKPFYLSSGAIGAAVSIIAGGATLVLKLDPEQSKAVADMTSQVLQTGLEVISVAASALALYGRLTATKRLTLGASTPVTPKENSQHG